MPQLMNTLTHPVHFRFWNAALKRQLEVVQNFAELACVFVDVTGHLPGKACMASGAISTGGFGTKRKNMRVFERGVEVLEELSGLTILSQMPLEQKMGELARSWFKRNPTATYCEPILEIVYGTVMATHKIEAFYFMPGWRSSRGARWERRECPKWGIQIRPYPWNWYREACFKARLDPADLIRK